MTIAAKRMRNPYGVGRFQRGSGWLGIRLVKPTSIAEGLRLRWGPPKV
jgi:hypothetical protein